MTPPAPSEAIFGLRCALVAAVTTAPSGCHWAKTGVATRIGRTRNSSAGVRYMGGLHGCRKRAKPADWVTSSVARPGNAGQPGQRLPLPAKILETVATPPGSKGVNRAGGQQPAR